MSVKVIHTIYCVTNKLNGKRYIGYTARTLKTRKIEHLSAAKRKDDQPFHKALNAVGRENWLWEELYQSWDTNDHTLTTMEGHFIREMKSHVSEWGYNATWGGERNRRGTVSVVIDDKICTISVDDPRWTDGELHHYSKGKKLWTNGKIAKMATSCPGDGWWQGSRVKGMKRWRNGKERTLSHECPGEGWIAEGLTAGKHWWHKDDRQTLCADCPGKGWQRGMKKMS
jgi:group I intron endonuclease